MKGRRALSFQKPTLEFWMHLHSSPKNTHTHIWGMENPGAEPQKESSEPAGTEAN